MKIRKLFIVCISFVFFFVVRSSAQSTFNCYIANDVLISPTVYQFDVYIVATGTDFNIRTVQIGLQFNPSFIAAGATITGSIVPSTTQLNSYTTGSPQWNAQTSCLSVPANTGGFCSGSPANSNTTLFSISTGAQRVASYRLTSSLPFTCASPNISMIRPSDPPPTLGVYKMAVTAWSASCLAQTISPNGTYTNFGANSLYSLVSNLRPNVTLQSTMDTVCVLTGDTGVFIVIVNNYRSGEPISYQWFENGAPLMNSGTYSGVNTNKLNIFSPSFAFNGSLYVCQVSYCDSTYNSPSGILIGDSCPVSVMDINKTDVTCFGDSNGMALITFGGSGADSIGTYILDGNIPQPYSGNPFHISGLTAGQHTITISSLPPFTSQPFSFNIGSPTPFNLVNCSATDVSVCFGNSNGSLSTYVSGGSLSTSFLLTGPVSDSNSTGIFNNLIAGIYTVTAVNECGILTCTEELNQPSSPDDNNFCTSDYCDQATGAIYHLAIDVGDNNLCTDDVCDPATGTISHLPTSTSDNDLCTTDECDPIIGVFHNPVNRSDGNLCTIDLCDAFYGVFHLPLNINDGDACTIDYCDPGTGIISHPAVNIDDNNLCTTDGCHQITGVYHQAISPNDGNACSIDVCDPAIGVLNYFVNIDDYNDCTIDACDPQTGNISHTNSTPVITISTGNILCYGGTTCVTVTATGGVPPYNGTGVFCGYQQGTHIFNVNDSNRCMISSSVTVLQPEKLNVSTNVISSSCGLSDGALSFSVDGGTGPYEYLLNGIPSVGNSPQFSGLSGGTYNWSVIDIYGCSKTGTINITESGSLPATPTQLYGPGGACVNQINIVYRVDSVPGATSYQWNLPSGMIGSSTTNSITVNISSGFIGGIIYARAANACGSGAPVAINVLLLTSKPVAPSSIIGPSYVCGGETINYCIPNVPGATYYSWIVSGNANQNSLSIISGQGTNCVNVLVPPGYNGKQQIKVKAGNCVGLSAERKLSVRLKETPKTPNSISGPSTVCKTAIANYVTSNVNGASDYLWTISSGATITSGQGTNSITVDFSSSLGNSSVVSVAAGNNCGYSTALNLNILINPLCRITDSSVSDKSDPFDESISIFPNPTSGKISVLYSGDDEQNFDITVHDMLGNRLKLISGYVDKKSNILHLDLSDLARGMYLLKIETLKSGVKTLPVIIE